MCSRWVLVDRNQEDALSLFGTMDDGFSFRFASLNAFTWAAKASASQVNLMTSMCKYNARTPNRNDQEDWIQIEESEWLVDGEDNSEGKQM